jgi:hypothetical protein
LNVTENLMPDGIDAINADVKDGRGWRVEAHCKVPIPHDNLRGKMFPSRHSGFGVVHMTGK